MHLHRKYGAEGKIDAILLLRDLTKACFGHSIGLKDAKDLIEQTIQRTTLDGYEVYVTVKVRRTCNYEGCDKEATQSVTIGGATSYRCDDHKIIVRYI